MAPQTWKNGNEYTDWVKLMSLTKINDSTYESASPAYSPGGFTRAFGGHVYAQAAYAAAHTVKKGFVLHSITGWFTLQGDTTKPFTYHISTVREGGSYCQRQINVTQDPTKGVAFTCICSFKRPEASINAHSLKVDFESQYASVLDGKSPDDHPECPGVDSPYMWEIERKRGWVDKFPGLKTRKVDMARWNEGRPPLERRQLMFYKVIGGMPSVVEDANLHAVAHLYASDRNGLFTIPNFLDLGDNYMGIASLNHTVILHQEAEGLALTDAKTGKPYDFIGEERIDHIGHGRGLACWRLFREDGAHVASSFQDGLLRMAAEGQQGNAAAQFDGSGKGGNARKSDEKL